MKAAVFIEGGSKQVILTPESDFDKQIIESMFPAGGKIYPAKVFLGQFYKCNGGWWREGYNDSLIVCFEKEGKAND